jgi:polysaccharide biosynthesis/export protein
MRRAINAGMVGALLIACASTAQGQARGDLEAPLRTSDLLKLSVWPDTELSGEYQVEGDGKVYLPFLGGLDVAGVPVSELRERVRSGLQAAQRNAIVTVTPLYRIGVMGAVRSPGLYFVPPTDGFFDVIAQAGGFNVQADESKVRVVREGQVVRLDARKALDTGEMLPLQALSVRSGDQIMVPAKGPGWGPRDFIALGSFLISAALLYDRLSD